MRIDEIFDSGYSYVWTRKGSKGWTNEWHGEFTPTDGNTVKLTIGAIGDDSWNIDFTREHQGRGSVSATGQGDQVKIFATITKMLKEFESEEHPHMFRFTTYKEESRESDSRPKLYRSIARTFAKDFNLTEHEAGGKIRFKLTRKTEFDNLSDDQLVAALGETSSAGSTSAGAVASSVGGLGAGFSDDYSKSIYGEPVVIRRNPKPKKRK